MLNPKLQTLNSFGFLRESKKTLNIPGTLLQEIIITSRIENFQSTARTSRASTTLRWTSNSKSTVHSKYVSRQLAPLLQQKSQQHELFKQSATSRAKWTWWTFLPCTQHNIKIQETCNCNKVPIICKPNATMISFHLSWQISKLHFKNRGISSPNFSSLIIHLSFKEESKRSKKCNLPSQGHTTAYPDDPFHREQYDRTIYTLPPFDIRECHSPSSACIRLVTEPLCRPSSQPKCILHDHQEESTPWNSGLEGWLNVQSSSVQNDCCAHQAPPGDPSIAAHSGRVSLLSRARENHCSSSVRALANSWLVGVEILSSFGLLEWRSPTLWFLKSGYPKT